MAEYAKDVLVEPEWLEQHLDDDSIRIVEVDENPALYREATSPERSDSIGARISRTRSSGTSSDPRTSASCSAAAASPTTTW